MYRKASEMPIDETAVKQTEIFEKETTKRKLIEEQFKLKIEKEKTNRARSEAKENFRGSEVYWAKFTIKCIFAVAFFIYFSAVTCTYMQNKYPEAPKKCINERRSLDFGRAICGHPDHTIKIQNNSYDCNCKDQPEITTVTK